MSPAEFTSLDALLEAAPLDLGATGWAVLSTAELDSFERATGRPSAGFMAVSLTNRFLPELLQVPAASSGLNYGAESVRFGCPLGPGSRLRARACLVGVERVAGGVQTTVEITVEVDGEPEPACVVRSLSRWMA